MDYSMSTPPHLLTATVHLTSPPEIDVRQVLVTIALVPHLTVILFLPNSDPLIFLTIQYLSLTNITINNMAPPSLHTVTSTLTYLSYVTQLELMPTLYIKEVCLGLKTWCKSA